MMMMMMMINFLQIPPFITVIKLVIVVLIMILTTMIRTSYCSVNDEIDDDDRVSMAITVIAEKLYVALGKDLKEGERILLWALKNSGGRKICILHVHQPDQMIPFIGGKFPAKKMDDKSVRAHREVEIQKMHKVLNEYLLICKRFGVQAEKLHIESDCIEKGIVKIISEYGMKRLVMGATAAKQYYRKKSKKAVYVNAEAPVTCHIWFIWKGHLSYTREGVGLPNEETTHEVQQPSPNPEVEKSDPVIARSVTRPDTQINHLSPIQNHNRAMSANLPGRTVPERHSKASSEEQKGTSRIHISQASHLSTFSSGVVDSSLALAPYVSAEGTRGSQDEIEMHLCLPVPKLDVNQVSPPSVLEESGDYQLYNQLEQAMTEARNSRREAFEESMRRGKAEQDAVDAILKARSSERLYAEELKQRKELEAALLKQRLELEQAMAEATNVRREAFEESTRRGKAEQEAVDATRRARASEKVYAEELNRRKELEAALLTERLESEKVQNQRDKHRDELQHARDQQSRLERRVTESAELFTKYKKERDELQIECDSAHQLAEDLRCKQEKSSGTNVSKLFSEISFLEIEDATVLKTRSFHPSLKIGEGDYGRIYKGLFRHTEVAIKMFHTKSLRGPSEYQHEVDVLSKLRHPNIVTLIGACPEFLTLIYEYLPNGSLEDRLTCKDNSPPLSWQTRIRIAAELCSALVFLHSSNPRSVVHGDLRPSNILLDANFVSELSNFGICRVVSPDEHASLEATTSYRADPQDTFAFMGPEPFLSGELTTTSDVYSFGVVLLRLLTGKASVDITMEVRNALDNGKLKSVLDYSAGDWPYVQACQLAHLALRCVEKYCENRPNLRSEVWRVLQAMRASCGGFASSTPTDEANPPYYFVCPIFQEVMQDPHVAADGFTYEAEALKGWLDSGHDTSPMTNLKLAHTNLVPNLALRSAIQEWLHKQKV